MCICMRYIDTNLDGNDDDNFEIASKHVVNSYDELEH